MINIQKSIAFLYTSNEILEKEYKNMIPFKIAPQKIKYLGIHLTKEVKDLYAQNYKTLIKEIKEMERYSMFMDWKNQYCKNGHTTQSNLQIQCNPYPITHDIFQELEQTIQKFRWNYRRPNSAKAILKNKNQAGGITLPDLRQYYKAAVIKRVWYWYQNRQTDQ